MSFFVRPEPPQDTAAVREVHRAAFGQDAEARLVDQLRAHGEALVSLVVELDGAVVGHILFSPVSLEGETLCHGVGLAPVAVLPAFQRQGMGTRLIEAGLAVCREADFQYVVVLGEPHYYGRFGFAKASSRGLGNEYGADHAFMVLELRLGALPPETG